MMASTHTSTSCSPTPLDLPFAYSSYNTDQESNSNEATDTSSSLHNAEEPIAITNGNQGPVNSLSHGNTNSVVPHPENALRYNFDPDYYSCPPNQNQSQNQSPESISFTFSGAFVPTNEMTDRRSSNDDGYSGYVAISEGTNELMAPFKNEKKALTNQAKNNRQEEDPPARTKQINYQHEQKQVVSDSPSNLFVGADTYRYGSDMLSLLLDADSLYQEEQFHIVGNCEAAQKAANEASVALQNGEFEEALQKHTFAARAYRDVALSVQDLDISLFNSLLLLSQAQARSGTSLLALHQSNTIKLQNQLGSNQQHLHQKYPNQLQEQKRSPPHQTFGENAPSNQNTVNAKNGASTTIFSSSADINSSSTQSVNQSSAETSSSSKSTNATLIANNVNSDANQPTRTSISNEEKIRATIRGALSDKKEADITDSTFLGMAASKTNSDSTSENHNSTPVNPGIETAVLNKSLISQNKESIVKTKNSNPVDELMKLEKELKDMDLAVQLGSSMASISLARANSSRLRQSSIDDGSFCVVRPGSNSVMTGSGIIATPTLSAQNRSYNNNKNNFEAGIRKRASRLHPFAKNEFQTAKSHTNVTQNLKQNNDDISLDSSWWASSSTHSSLLSSSSIMNSSMEGGSQSNVANIQVSTHYNSHHDTSTANHSAMNTKQVMRLLDSLKTLGDENAALLKEVEEAQAARLEAKAAREQMKTFKAEYGKRFSRLKAALDKVRKEDNSSISGVENPLTSSDYVTSKAIADAKKKDQMIQKLATDLRKEREESKKKDVALRKYENFYKEVKLKALQRQKEQERLVQLKQGKTKSSAKAAGTAKRSL